MDFRIYWRYNKTEIVSGVSIEDAFSNAGYGGGGVRAIDFYSENTEITHTWNNETHEWDRITPII